MGEYSRMLASWLVIALSIACFYPIIPSAWNSAYGVTPDFHAEGQARGTSRKFAISAFSLIGVSMSNNGTSLSALRR